MNEGPVTLVRPVPVPVSVSVPGFEPPRHQDTKGSPKYFFELFPRSSDCFVGESQKNFHWFKALTWKPKNYLVFLVPWW